MAAYATINTALQMQTGNPSNATADANNHTHYLIQRPQYALDYNDTTHEPNWVAWDLTSDDTGSSGRSNFIVDTTLPAGFYQVLTTDYSGSGYDRGHMCPSADRTVTAADNQQVFYMSNMIPQAPDNNQGVWANFENYCRTIAAAGNELLIISGPSEFAGSTIASGVAIPGYTWKIVVVVPLGSGTAIDRINAAGAAAIRVIAVRIPNVQGVRSDPWQNYITSVSVIEAKTGFTFFTGLPAATASAFRAKVDGQTATGAPSIVTPPSAQTAPVGGTATFSVTATATDRSPLTYQWSKDDTDIPGATGATLTLTNIQAADAGNYDVVVSNAIGSATSSAAALVVTGLPPVITTSPASLTGTAGSTAVFSVVVSGSPTLTYLWRKGGVALSNGGNVSGATGATLTLSNIQSADVANYDVVVTNSVGTATSAIAALNVTPSAPTITSQPVAQTVSAGGTAVFSVTASGTTPFTYQWRKGGIALTNTGVVSGATTASLTLTGVTSSDVASYDVVVSNGVGSPATSSTATLTIAAAVAGRVSYTGGTYAQNFDTLPITGNLTFSGTAPFDLTASPINAAGMTGWTVSSTLGTPTLIAGTGTATNGAVYSFGAAGSTERALGTIASGSVVPRFGVTLVNNTGVTITQFTVSYVGEWWRNGGNASLAAQTLPFFFSIGATDINASSPAFTGVAALGFTSPTPTSATGAAVDGNAAANRKSISSTVTGVSWAPGQTLVLRWDDINDTGNDHALAVDDFSFSTPVSAAPTAPTITSTVPASGATNVATSSPITISFNQSVNVAGSWFAINSAANGATAATVTGGPTSFVLTPPTSFANSDTITVTLFASQITESASNTLHPAANTTFSFTTAASNAATPPTVTTQPVAQTVNVGATATFTVVASGTAPLTFQWSKNGTAISGNASATTATLTLTNVATTDAGNYTCIVSNSAGSDVSTAATLTVNVVAPSITTQPVAQTVSAGTNATFTVVASGTAPLSYQWRKNGVALTDSAVVSGSATATLLLTSVSATDVGGYDVVVTNSASSVSSSVASLSVSAPSSSMIVWNFNAATPSSGLPADLSGGNGGLVTQNNNNGTTAILTSTSASNNTGASGGNNAGAAARIGALNTAAGGSAYFEFTLTPATGEQVQISALSFGARSTSTGPQAYTIYTSADAFAAPVASGALANDSVWRLITPALSAWITSATSAPLTVRIYGFNGAGSPSASTANWRIDDLKVAARGLATAPIIVSTSPAAGAANVALNAPISITFNQPVAVSSASFSVTSATSGPVTATVGGGSTSFTLTPAANFGYNDTITVTVVGAQVTELNSNTLTLGANTTFSFTTIPPTPPSIVTPPAAKTATVGDSVTFNVEASGTASFGYQWRKGGVALVGNTSATTDTLSLSNITTADAGDYDVVVTNIGGTAISVPATLTVNKAVASVTLANLTATYDGAPKPVTVGTTPGGLGIVVTYDGGAAAPTNAGSYTVVATIADANYVGAASGTLTINRAPATVALSNLGQTYTGAPLTATVTTAPLGLAVALTYDGSATAPSNAGSYAVAAAITNPNYVGSTSGTLTIAKATATVALSGLAAIYDGSAKPATAITVPAGLNVSFTYNGSATAPTNAGSYQVIAAIADMNYVGTATSALVVDKATATVTLSGLTATYDGTPHVVTAATLPANLNVVFTYDGGATAPTNAGSYAVVATIVEANYKGSASGLLVVAKGTATIGLTNTTQIYDGAAKQVTVTTTPASLATSITYDGSGTVPVSAGTYVITATITDQNYSGSTTGSLTIDKAVVPVLLTNLAQAYDGTPKSVTATASLSGLAINITYNSSPIAPTAAGSYAVVASISNANYRGSSSGTLVIAPADATIALSNLAQAYDGTPKSVTIATTPAGLPTNITYNGSATAPTNPGTYAVVATITDSNYYATTSGTLVITTTALVRHAPSLDGGLDGSLQILTGESFTLNGSAWVSGDILAPGTPTVRLNGHPTFAGTQDGTGSTSPSNYQLTLNGNAVLRYLVRRTDPIAMAIVSAPPVPTGTRDVSINNAGQSVGSFATLRNLTLNGNVGTYAVPAGTYGAFNLNGNSGLALGVAGATTPSVYNLQGLTLNGNSSLQILGPVVIVLANGVSISASVGTSAHPEWLVLDVADGSVTLNGNVSFYGSIIAPAGTVTINGNSTLVGGVVADRLTINGNGLLKQTTP